MAFILVLDLHVIQGETQKDKRNMKKIDFLSND